MHPSVVLLPAALWAAAVVPSPGHAEEPGAAAVRPPTWDMSREQLEASGLGQSRGDPRPVPRQYPRLNAGPRPTEGGQPPPWVIFVNFDGATLTAGMDSAQNNVTQIAECAGEFAPYGVGDKRTAVMQATRADWAAYNIDVVDVRPAAGEYTMNMTGPTNPFGGGVLGIAPVDCGNFQTHSNITYAFHSIDDGFDAATTATTIGQEVAHSYGLDHVDAPQDILNPVNVGGDPSFVDECLPLVGNSCPDQHAQHCPDGAGQNSHQELLTLFGPSIPDTTGPVVLITAPLSGTTFEPGSAFTVLVTITDDSQVAETELYINGQYVDVDTSAPWGFQVNDVPSGLYAIEVVATDEYDNQGLSTPISILVAGGDAQDSEGDEGDPADGSGGAGSGSGSGSDGGETEGAGQDEDGKGCGCAQSGGTPAFAAGPLLLLLGLRRRRAAARPGASA
jgi:uncharacterized protein (TIGR03382 family)